jgi:hypothetical protein
MEPDTAEISLKASLKEMRERLEKAVSIATAAEACADAGSIEKGVALALDVEQLVYEASTFLNAASLINRCQKLIDAP